VVGNCQVLRIVVPTSRAFAFQVLSEGVDLPLDDALKGLYLVDIQGFTANKSASNFNDFIESRTRELGKAAPKAVSCNGGGIRTLTQ